MIAFPHPPTVSIFCLSRWRWFILLSVKHLKPIQGREEGCLWRGEMRKGSSNISSVCVGVCLVPLCPCAANPWFYVVIYLLGAVVPSFHKHCRPLRQHKSRATKNCFLPAYWGKTTGHWLRQMPMSVLRRQGNSWQMGWSSPLRAAASPRTWSQKILSCLERADLSQKRALMFVKSSFTYYLSSC